MIHCIKTTLTKQWVHTFNVVFGHASNAGKTAFDNLCCIKDIFKIASKLLEPIIEVQSFLQLDIRNR